jgi:predicted RecA/RadA family phage recombinase
MLIRRLDHGNHLPSVVVPSGVVGGDLVLLGDLVGVASTDRSEDGLATVEIDGSFMLNVQAVNGAGNSAVALWDLLYYTAGDTVKLSKKTTGVLAGRAMEGITSGATKVIEVLLVRK